MMAAYSESDRLLVLWIVFAVLGLAALVAVLVWAVRAGQFRGQDRARYLPLQSGIPAEKADETQASRRDEGGKKGSEHASPER